MHIYEKEPIITMRTVLGVRDALVSLEAKEKGIPELNIEILHLQKIGSFTSLPVTRTKYTPRM